MSEDDRREFPRAVAKVPVVLQVELHGYDAEDTRFRANGRTVNMSRSGLLARIDFELAKGTHCLAHFPSATGQLGRTMIYGTVQRCDEAAKGWQVAVSFDNPLLDLDLPLAEPED